MNAAIGIFYGLARAATPTPPPEKPDPVDDSDIYAEATIYASKMQLKRLMAAFYSAHGAGGALEKFPPTSAIGAAISGAAYGLERKAIQEYQTLNLLEEFAYNTRKLKEGVIELTGQLMRYEESVVRNAPRKSREAAEQIAQANQATGALYPQQPQLPLAPQDENVDIERSQLVRASYPWVLAWRKPIRDVMRWVLFLSGASKHYRTYTQRYAKDKAQEVREQQGLHLFVVKDFTPPGVEKFEEPWINDSRRAEALFTVMGFAHREFSARFSPSVYVPRSQDGLLAYAQAMTYNANPNRRASDGRRQAEVGWDTLNWLHDGSPIYEWAADVDDEPDAPRIRINWQVKLIPATRLGEARGRLPAPFAPIIQRTLPEIDSLQTH
jgi:hypothetical protein